MRASEYPHPELEPVALRGARVKHDAHAEAITVTTSRPNARQRAAPDALIRLARCGVCVWISAASSAGELPTISIPRSESFWRISGSARIRTVSCRGEIGLIRQILAQPGAECVLVIDNGGTLDFAVFGDAMAGNVLRNGWSGVVVHGAILGAGITLIEGLVNLRDLPPRVRFFAPFYKFSSVESAPARAFALIDTE